jgi:hypothetical protein
MSIEFTREIIGELRARIVAHNRAVTSSAQEVRLGPMKGLYKRWYGGKIDPHGHALAKIDEHLAMLREGALNKANERFNPGRHPRGRRGQFRGTGSGGGSGGRPPPSRGEPDTSSPAYVPVGIIPETRYSLYGPGTAAAAGVVLGAAQGTTASFRGSYLDRGTTHVLRGIGGLAGRVAGEVAAGVTVAVPVAAVHHITRIANARMGTRLPVPPITAGRAAKDAIRRTATETGHVLGAAAGHASAFSTNALPALARLATKQFVAPGLKGHALTALVGGVVGGATTGALVYAPAFRRIQQTIGPYEDAMWPRRVYKLAGPLWNAPEVLAKQAELFALDEELAKASFGAIARGISGIARTAIRRVPGIRGATRVRPARAMAPGAGPGSAAFTARAPQFQVNRALVARAAVVAGHVGAIAGAGAGVGALGGSALGLFNQKHPRGTHGRFRRAGTGSVAGAQIGAAAGAIAGLGMGLVAARRGHAGMLLGALSRLRGTAAADPTLAGATGNVPFTPAAAAQGDTAAQAASGVNLPASMRAETRRAAERAHAQAFVTVPANKKKIPAFTVASTNEPEHVANSLRSHAIAAWEADEGQIIRQGAKVWYTRQLENGFNRSLYQELHKLPAPIPGKNGLQITASTGNLLNHIDEEALNPEQLKIWTDHIRLRQSTLDQVNGVYTARTAAATGLSERKAALSAERTVLHDMVRDIPDEWEKELRRDPTLTLANHRAWAREKLGFVLPANIRSRDSAILAIDNEIPPWRAAQHQKINAIDEELDPKGVNAIEPKLREATDKLAADLTDDERAAIINPFSQAQKPFFRPFPLSSRTDAEYQALKQSIGDKAAKPFLDAMKAHADAAEAHLESLIHFHDAALEARLPRAGAVRRALNRTAPMLAARLPQGVRDFSAVAAVADMKRLTEARRAQLDGVQKVVADFLHANTNPGQAWKTTKELSDWVATKATQTGQFALKNWKPIAGVIGPLTAIGAIDVTAPSGKRFKVNPKRWHAPKNMGVVFTRPDAIRKPHELIAGLTFEGPDRQRTFVQGIHIHSADGQYHDLPFGANVNDVFSAIRGTGGGSGGGGGGGAGGGPAKDVEVPDKAVLDTALTRLNSAGHIRDAGPAGFEYKQRAGGDATKAETDYRDSFYKTRLERWQGFGFRPGGGDREKTSGSSTKHAEAYFGDLKTLFDAPGAAVLGADARVGLLIGKGNQRGIFANKGGPFKPNVANADKKEVTDELVRQLAEQGHTPRTPEQYVLLRRATHLVGQHYGLSTDQHARIVAAADKHFRDANGGRNPPTSANISPAAHVDTTVGESILGGAYDKAWDPRVDDAPAADFIRNATQGRPDRTENDQITNLTLEATAHKRYEFAYSQHQLRNPDATREQSHQFAQREIGRWLTAQKIEGAADLMKALGEPALPKVPKIKAPKVPAIAGAAAPTASAHPLMSRPMVPTTIPATPHAAGGDGGALQSKLKDIGSYGLSQVGWSATSQLLHHYLPKTAGSFLGRVGIKTARIAGEAAGGYGGMVAGEALGAGLGSALGSHGKGPKQSTGEVTARTLAGGAAQLGAGYAVPAAARALGWGAVAAEGAEAGGVMGTSLGPFGTVGGAALGATTALVGTGAAYLTSEGAGMLYRYLNRYGAHMPHAIAHQLNGGNRRSRGIRGAATQAATGAHA